MTPLSPVTTGRTQFGSGRRRHPGTSVTGSRRWPAKAGSRCSACTGPPGVVRQDVEAGRNSTRLSDDKHIDGHAGQADMSAVSRHEAGPSRVARFVPIVGWLPKYQRSWLPNDAVAGFTIWGLLIPEMIAYASLAGLSPQAGLYTFSRPSPSMPFSGRLAIWSWPPPLRRLCSSFRPLPRRLSAPKACTATPPWPPA